MTKEYFKNMKPEDVVKRIYNGEEFYRRVEPDGKEILFTIYLDSKGHLIQCGSDGSWLIESSWILPSYGDYYFSDEEENVTKESVKSRLCYDDIKRGHYYKNRRGDIVLITSAFYYRAIANGIIVQSEFPTIMGKKITIKYDANNCQNVTTETLLDKPMLLDAGYDLMEEVDGI